MTSLVKCAIGAAVLAAVVYLSFFVSFGGKSLYAHVAGIGRSAEARTLGREIEKKTRDVRDDLSKEIGKRTSVLGRGGREDAAGRASTGTGPSPEDRKALTDLVRAKAEVQPSDADRTALRKLVSAKAREND